MFIPSSTFNLKKKKKNFNLDNETLVPNIVFFFLLSIVLFIFKTKGYSSNKKIFNDILLKISLVFTIFFLTIALLKEGILFTLEIFNLKIKSRLLYCCHFEYDLVNNCVDIIFYFIKTTKMC